MNAAVLYEAAMAALSAGRIEDVVPLTSQALAADPGHGPSWILLARLALESGDEAMTRTLLEKVPARTSVDVATDAATLWDRLGDPARAVGVLEHAGASGPLAALHERAGRLPEAVRAWEAACEADPTSVEALNQLASVEMRRTRFLQAETALARAVALRPDLSVLWENLGRAATMAGKAPQARAAIDRALALGAPGTTSLRWLRARALPVVVDTEEELAAERAHYATGLEELAADVALGTAEQREDALAGIQDAFHVHYQGEPLLELQRRHGALVHRIAQASLPGLQAAPSGSGGRLRVGFVSTFLREHTVMKLFGGWLRGLDRARFDVRGYHIGDVVDETTRSLAAACDGFAHLPGTLEEATAAILADRPDALIYPEIGMDARTLPFAALRLASVQAVAWGHPITTGLPTIDCFLTSDLMEPSDGERHYTERLVRLPGLSVALEPFDPGRATRTRAELGLPAGGPLYVCCQSLFKVLPRHDELFARIAAEVPDARFAFIALKSPHATDLFLSRMTRAFAAAGLDAARHVTMLPVLSWRHYLDLNLVGDVFLDTIGWSGGQTTLEAIACGLPPVTLPGETMRSRHTAAILQRMGLTDLIADTADAYVDIAARLGRDPAWRASIRARLIAARGALYGDRECVAALERFLVDAVEAA